MPQMDKLMFVRLPRLIKQQERTIGWHYNSRCTTCDWQTECRQRSESEQTVSMIPDLSLEDSNLLRSAIEYHASENRISDIEDLYTLTRRDKMRSFEQSSPHTAKEIRRLLGMLNTRDEDSAVLNAIKDHSPQVRRMISTAKCRY